MSFSPDRIRNIAVVGHQSSGKTSLCEALIYKAGAISKKGSIDQKNTISDYLPDEKKKLSSLQSSILSFDYNDYHYNLIDIPGNDDFIFEMLGVTRIVKGAILVIDASKGVQVGTIKAFNRLRKRGVPIFIFINKMDNSNVNFNTLYEDICDHLDEKKCVPFTYPLGKEDKFDGFVNVVELKARIYNGTTCVDGEIYDDKKQIIFELHNRLCEAVATTNDELLEKFFSSTPLTNEEIKSGLRQGILSGELYPLIVGSAIKDIGCNTLLNMFKDYFPSPADLNPIKAKDESNHEILIKTNVDDPLSLSIFKTTFNSYQGLISTFKVHSGKVKVGDELYCPNTSKTYKINTLFTIFGEKLTPVKEISAGDIGATTKLDDLRLSYSLVSLERKVVFDLANYPTATYFKGIIPTSKNDSDKLFSAAEKLSIEDPCIKLEKNDSTNQILIGGLSSSHLNYILDRLKDEFGIKYTLEEAKISYRETITKTFTSEGRYIKQSGGSGYYGVVSMEFSPSNKTEFDQKVFGGHVSKGYFPAVEKGFYEALEKGGLTSSPVINVKGVLLDGKEHPVDSNEMAFKNAAIVAFRNAYDSLGPILLEPYYKITIAVGNEYLGNILSDLTKRRARIVSTEDKDGNSVEIIATVPQAEILEYANEIKSITKATGYFNLEFNSYEPVPKNLSDSIINKLKENS